MPIQRPKTSFWAVTPPWIILGALLTLAPLFAYFTVETVHRRNELTTELLLEKGAALIRSFEAGARTGMMGMQWGGLQIQRLLMETARQPDIQYLIVTDENGRILAHSDPDLIGGVYGTGIDLEQAAASQTPNWRRLPSRSGKAPTFEVYRQFSPTRLARNAPPGKGPAFNASRKPGAGRGDWCRPHFQGEESNPGSRQVIFVGLDTGPIEAARSDDTKHTIFMTGILLLIGLAALVLLFLAQAYRTTHLTLSRVQAFTGNLVEKMPVGLLAVNADGRFTTVNQTAGRMLRLDSEALLGKPARETLPTPLSSVLEKAMQDLGPIEKETELSMGKDPVMPLDVIGTPLRREDGEHLGALIILRDLTEIQHLKAEVARSQRLASVGKLAAGLAHEIRNPLSSIKGFATWFKQRHQDDPADLKTATIMIQEIERLNRVISQLLEFARPRALQREKTDLRNLILQSLETVRGQAQNRNIRIESLLETDLGPIQVDRDRISQMLLNLYLNAMDAMEGGGVMTVSLQRADEPGGVAVNIMDTGKGIGEQDLPHIFDPYYTTKPTGTGLGLAIVHNIVEAHGGDISVASTEGAGTTVTVRLPGPSA